MTNPTEVLSVVLLVGGVSLMLVAHLLVVFWALRRGLGSRGTRHADAERSAADVCGGGLSAGEIAALPCHDFVKAAADGGSGDCAVCLEAFEAGDQCRRLPRCEHSFHAACVDSWLRKRSACPVCRTDAVHRELKGEEKAGAGTTGAVEMVNRSPTAAALEIVTER
ncbi:hypothetical protein BS78_10G115800 [Paspalum vaginatum]|nr:hypothetical protein BS78_10G115800 [Paspalum vaginatum]KAJ1258955.1 hypothetical protein BS78_10G115800 [Paspalum vaginatum]